MSEPPKLHVLAFASAMDGPGMTKNLITGVERVMRSRGMINSASGRTAALAVNYCERHGLDYTLRRESGRYFLHQSGMPLELEHLNIRRRR